MQAMRSRRCRMHPKWQLGSPASDRTWLGLHANLSKYVLIIFCTFLWIDSSRPLIYWCCCSTEIRKPSLSTGHSPFSSAASIYLLLSLNIFSPLWFSFVWHYHVANAMELCCKQCVSITKYHFVWHFDVLKTQHTNFQSSWLNTWSLHVTNAEVPKYPMWWKL